MAERALVTTCRLDRKADPVTQQKEYRWNRAYELTHADSDAALTMLNEYRQEVLNFITRRQEILEA